MKCARLLFVVAALCAACHDGGRDPAPTASAPKAVEPAPETIDPQLAHERELFISDAMAFTGMTREQVYDKTVVHQTGMRDEWNAWAEAGPMTDERIKQFYKQTINYIFDLGGWHLWDVEKRKSDLALVDQMRAAKVKNILDFGGGVGLNSVMLAQAGFDVTLADLDSKTLAFAEFRAARRGVKLKIWKTDVEPMPPDGKYDAILCLDVLEHLPKDVLHETVDKLIELKTPTTQIIIHAPFGKTATHPMHLDLTDDTKQQIERLKTELPKP
jgi:2-polyprenyl-3-methyl-5-hydroxy-6-metoxy-1,4-benzoquinol methylase